MIKRTLIAILITGSALGAATAPAYARQGADDPVGHVRRGRGADDAAGNTRRGRGADDPAGHVRHGRGSDDGPNHR